MCQSLAGGRQQRGPPGAQRLPALLESYLLLSPLSLSGVCCGAWQQKVSQGKRSSSKERLQTTREAVHGNSGNASTSPPGQAVSAARFAASERGQSRGSPPLAEPALVSQQPTQKTANARVSLQEYYQAQAAGLSVLTGAAVLPFAR